MNNLNKFHKKFLSMRSYIDDISRFNMPLNHVPIFAILSQSFKKKLMFIISPSSYFYSRPIFLFLLNCLSNSKFIIQILFAVIIAFIFIVCLYRLFSINFSYLKHCLNVQVLKLLLNLVLSAIDI